MIVHPNFDPIAFSIGPVAVHWYGLMYLAGFALGGWLGVQRAGHNNNWRTAEIWDLVFYCAVGVICGGRLGYALFYQPEVYLQNPWALLAIWRGGMSFHGGLLGVACAMWLYARKTGRGFLSVGDFISPLIAPGLGLGRLGNFINQELWGRPTELPWGVWFHTAPGVARHPSQLYEFALEGVVLFAVLWWYSARPRAIGRVSGVFLLGYGFARFVVEFFREPDAHLGLVLFGWMTLGQILCLPMLVAGLWLWRRRAGR